MRRLAIVAVVGLVVIAGGIASTAVGTTDGVDAPMCDEVSYDTDGGADLIENVSQLQCIEDNGLDEDYRLVDDIDASVTEDWNDGKGFEPIGDGKDSDNFSDDADYFEAIFAGNGHTIDGLHINRPDENGIGLFGGINGDGSTVSVVDLTLTNASVTGNDRVGILTGHAVDDTLGISNVHASGTVEGVNETAGLVGYNGDGSSDSGGEIWDSSANVTVTASGDRVAGLVGVNSGEVTTSYATGTITSTGDRVGGLVGREPIAVVGTGRFGLIGRVHVPVRVLDCPIREGAPMHAPDKPADGGVACNGAGRVRPSDLAGVISDESTNIHLALDAPRGIRLTHSSRASVLTDEAPKSVTGACDGTGRIRRSYLAAVDANETRDSVTGAGDGDVCGRIRDFTTAVGRTRLSVIADESGSLVHALDCSTGVNVTDT